MTPETVTKPFVYAVLRVIPCLERGEQMNAGVILFCRQLDFLDLKIELNRTKLSTIAPNADQQAIEQHLEQIRLVITGDRAGGALAAMDPSDRFGWLVAPSSTIIQTSPAHTGLTADPAAELQRLFRTLVL